MEDENSWVFDSLVCFLNGPIWNAPLQSFIEEKSLIFEPNTEDNEDYKKIFDEFKNLVDFMLGNFMEDIGITPEQFEHACKEGKRYQVSFDHNLFEQIWAANDYEMFKRIMTQRNVELQLQALELIEQKYGITPQSFIPKSKEEVDRDAPMTSKNLKLEKDIMDEVAKNFSTEESSASLEVQNILEEKEILEKTLQEAKEKVIGIVAPKLIEKATSSDESSDKKPSPKNNKKAQDAKIETRGTEIDAVELKKRQEYLRAQRDKLVALKKEARKKQLNAENDSQGKSRERPKSARAAQAVLTGETPSVPGELQIRRTLAERLKTEVVDYKEPK
ncbi:hypothetical protein NQ315_009603 [Exocentrus adspersus]|uniref:Cilia- and flagella-associated protein 36 n=1 Tax=Exocentrus adspersus TaxID=1586481 RepID=A0AAV8WHX4_9CUCU|nr:hypothetical protein NQ315_009603 [Exocentrus adspersus]